MNSTRMSTGPDHAWFYAQDDLNEVVLPDSSRAEPERNTVTTLRRERAGFGQLGRELGYLLPNLPITIAGFTVMLTGICLGFGLIPAFLIGLPVLALTLLIARGFANVERARLRILLGHPVGPVYYRAVTTTGWDTRPSVKDRRERRSWGLRLLRDPQLWRDWSFQLVSFPIRIATWSITVTWVAGALGGLSYVLWEWSLPSMERNSLWFMLGMPGRFVDIVLTTALGLFFLLTMPWVLRLLTNVEATVAMAMLTNETTALRARTEELSQSRQAVVRAEADTLRKVERDIHDGPQQRLVRLTMDLEAVQRRINTDPAAASEIVDSALVQTREALTELRALSRGIAPPILNDRGLHAALVAAAARCPIETVVNMSPTVEPRLAAAVENAAYFVVTESLTNVAKHSAAHQCVVSVDQFGRAGQAGAVLQLRIADDGRGGATTGKGHGLAGLADRLAGVDGRLTIDSPDGLGTVIGAEIPLPAN